MTRSRSRKILSQKQQLKRSLKRGEKENNWRRETEPKGGPNRNAIAASSKSQEEILVVAVQEKGTERRRRREKKSAKNPWELYH